MNKRFKKVISSVLAAVMTVGVVSVANVSSVFAETNICNASGVTSTTQTLLKSGDTTIISCGKSCTPTAPASTVTLESGKTLETGVSLTKAFLPSGTTNLSDDDGTNYGYSISLSANQKLGIYYTISNGDFSNSSKYTKTYSGAIKACKSTDTDTDLIGDTDEKKALSTVYYDYFESDNEGGTYYLYSSSNRLIVYSFVISDVNTNPTSDTYTWSVAINDDLDITAAEMTFANNVTTSFSNTLTYSGNKYTANIPALGANVDGVSKGEGTKIKDGYDYVNYNVTVALQSDWFTASANTSVTGVSVALGSSSIYATKTTKATATVTPDNATDTTVTWDSSDKSVATVDPSTGEVTGKGAGTADIIATSNSDGDVKGSAKITVLAVPVVEPTKAGGTIADLQAAKTTTIYNIREAATKVSVVDQTYPYAQSANLYFGDEVYTKGAFYQTGKATYDLDGTARTDGIRLKAGQDIFAFKLLAGSKIEIPVYGGGTSDRYAFISNSIDATSTEGALASSGNIGRTNGKPLTLEYTNNTGATLVVYVTATADSFFSQVKVTVPETTTITKATAKDKVAYIKTADGKEYAVAVVSDTDKASFYLEQGSVARTDDLDTVYASVTIGGTTYTVDKFVNGDAEGVYLYGFSVTTDGTISDSASVIADTTVKYNDKVTAEE